LKRFDGGLLLSATDLANHLACRHLTQLDRAAAEGRIDPPRRDEDALEALEERGFEHERAYLEHLAALGRTALRIEAEDSRDAFERTRAAMHGGHDVIVQATLASGRWHGRADVLLRVDAPSVLGEWSYEVVDTKLARETRGGTMLQLCAYSDMVREIQDRMPERMHVVTPGTGFEPQSYELREFLAYYRWVRARLEAAVASDPVDGATYPEPVDHCDICRWWSSCNRHRRADDHLSLVAGITSLHRRELGDWSVDTLAHLARLALPLERAPRRGSKDALVRVREQARVQLQGRIEERPVHELLDVVPGFGLARLPEPDPSDVFLDLEGDPFVAEGGLEFLFGVAFLEAGEWRYHARWATSRDDEKRAFEETVDFVMARWASDAGFHLYHYGDYEKSALKRLMGRHATREAEVDRLLRGERFVDLHAVVKRSVRASVERYSIKELERFYGYARAMPLDRSGPVLRAVQIELERGRSQSLDAAQREVVEAYNRDDCVSAARLRDWLEDLRAECVGRGDVVARPEPKQDAPSEKIDEATQRRRSLAARLLEGVPAARADRSLERHARYLLAHLLEFHRREEKAPWWEYFRLIECTDEELIEEDLGLGGLRFVERVGAVKKSIVDRYAFPRQETRIRAGEGKRVQSRDVPDIEVLALDGERCTIDLKKGLARAELHPTGVFQREVFRADVIADALERLAAWVADHGIDAPGAHRAARDLLLNRPPRLRAGATWRLIGEDAGDAARRLALELDHGVLPIQGPPGSGKTYTGARLIVDLVREGRKVGVVANSHKVITHLLEGVAKAAEGGAAIRIFQLPKETDTLPETIVRVDSNERMLAALESGEAQVAGGTAWMWSREEFAHAVDVLVVDEAGQLSLANTLGVVQSADSLILLGDPQQLDQPVQGSHPDGVAISALEHVLGKNETMPEERGLFLEHTRRLHPSTCAFTSEAFYAGRLESLAGLERQAVVGATPFEGAGLWYVAVAHEGNQNESLEEIEAIETLLDRIVVPGVDWIDEHGDRAALGWDDVLIVAPYNAQVWMLRERLPHARIGTVDKFQGQEAAVVIVSMTTSTPEDAPRGMDFLYSLHRLNVATSRARCACILVASPRLFEPDCKTPQQMRLANAFCRYREMARVVDLSSLRSAVPLGATP
jgi:predicted RecB family nuclease